MTIKRIIVTPGEPSGIGPDVLLKAIQESYTCELIAIVDPNVLVERAELLQYPFSYELADLNTKATVNSKGSIKIIPSSTYCRVEAGKLRQENAAYVIETLHMASKLCLQDPNIALVTGPVHKAILNDAGIKFSGHTEFFAECAGVKKTVMLFVVDEIKVALLTTHLPLKEVPNAITTQQLSEVLMILHQSLKTHFAMQQPRIGICGLNPHAGENGYLGREEIDVISPTLNALRATGMDLIGPLPADTLFTRDKLSQFDCVLAMYHDQGLPVVKYIGFDRAVNVTLGLPFIRTSVDHGTALDIAGRGQANVGSMIAAIKLAESMCPAPRTQFDER